MEKASSHSYWHTIWDQFSKKSTGMLGLLVIGLFTLVGIYAPFLASSKPIVVQFEGELYFPLFRYLFFSGFYTKRLDLFFNLLIFTFPFLLLGLYFTWNSARAIKWVLVTFLILQIAVFTLLILFPVRDPAADSRLEEARQIAKPITWDDELRYMNGYARLNLVLRYLARKTQHERLQEAIGKTIKTDSLWQAERDNDIETIERYKVSGNQQALQWIQDRNAWLEKESQSLRFLIMPLVRDYHWEEDAGGSQKLNRELPFMELTRINRKDLMAALIFGVRISLVVGIIAVAISLMIGIPVGAMAGFYGGKTDIIVSRLLEIWEAMPSFLMLLMIVAVAQSKSIFLVITVIGLFGWTQFSRYIRAEFFKQKSLAYVEACRSLGFKDKRIIFGHILPNAIPPLLTLLPFAIMAAISSEAGLSFLGLGEEGSCSWGVLMDEGRTAFPAESYLLWPPAILLVTLLIATALVGDALRDAFDPKMHR